MFNPYVVGNNNEGNLEEKNPEKAQSNNPVLSDNSPITLTLGEQKWFSAWVDGIYTEISDDELTVVSSNEDVLDIMSQQGWCSPGIKVIGTNETSECITTIDAYVSAKNIGTSVLTYYCQGKEIGKINVTVEPNIAETLSDELILKAKICADNPTYKHMVDTFNNPATLCTDSSSKVAAMMVEDLNSFIDAFSLEFDSKNYYEAVLMDMVTSDTFYDTVKDSLYVDNLEFAADKLNTVGSFAEDEINKTVVR